MTYYSADPPLVRRPSKLSPQDRLWRPPQPPPKDETSPRLSPRHSPQVHPSANNSPRLQPSSSPRLRPTMTSPSPHHQDAAVPPARQVSPPRQTYVHPTLKNIPFLDGLRFQARPPQPSTRALFHPRHPPTTERQVIAHSGADTGRRSRAHAAQTR